MGNREREIITSFANDKMRFVRKLQEKKFRDESGLFVCEGGNIVRDLPDCAEVSAFVVSDDRADEYARIFSKFPFAELHVVTKNVFESVSETRTPFGVLAVVKKTDTAFCEPCGNAVLLDRVRDSGNLGTIIRTLAACGFPDLYLLECADPFSGKCVRASMGGIFQIALHEISVGQAVSLCEAHRALTLDMGGENLFSLHVEESFLLVAGSEAHGVCKELSGASAKIVSLPMKNIESLNVATAVSVAAYHVKYGQ